MQCCRDCTARQSAPRSNPKQLRLRDQLLRRAAPHRAAALDDVVPVGNAGEIPDVLVDHQNRLAARFSTSTGSSRFPRGSAARGLRWPRPRISKGPARIGSSARGRSRLLNNARKVRNRLFVDRRRLRLSRLPDDKRGAMPHQSASRSGTQTPHRLGLEHSRATADRVDPALAVVWVSRRMPGYAAQSPRPGRGIIRRTLFGASVRSIALSA
jgi:hypothetical protein